MASTLVFAVKTIPDVSGIRRLHRIDASLPDADVVEYAFQRCRAAHGYDVLPLALHRVVVISCVQRDAQQFRLFSFASPQAGERSILRQFFDEVGHLAPRLVSWNGKGFGLPVLRHRGMLHGLAAPRGWAGGAGGAAAPLDLAGCLAGDATQASLSLRETVHLLGAPGWSEVDAWPAWQAGETDLLCDTCACEALATYGLFLRYQAACGECNAATLAGEENYVRAQLAASEGGAARQLRGAWPVGLDL